MKTDKLWRREGSCALFFSYGRKGTFLSYEKKQFAENVLFLVKKIIFM